MRFSNETMQNQVMDPLQVMAESPLVMDTNTDIDLRIARTHHNHRGGGPPAE
jgi:hypothetical protein